jgi:hypothetical protein
LILTNMIAAQARKQRFITLLLSSDTVVQKKRKKSLPAKINDQNVKSL